MGTKPWMPWYVAEFVADTQHLDAALTGAYMMLIGHYWQRGELPDDDAALARIARMDVREWRKAKPIIQAFFKDGWRHSRIDRELAHAADISSKRKSAAEQRHNKPDANAPANAQQMHTQSPLQSPSQEKVISLDSGKGKANGWTPPRHGSQSKKYGTVYVCKGTDEWPPYADDYRRTTGKEPVPDEGGGFWFKTAGAAPLPQPQRLSRGSC